MTNFPKNGLFSLGLTKSKGPKGLQLEVGARRAPKFLVFNIFYGQLFMLGSISARVLINRSVRACELGKLLLLRVSVTMVK